MLIYNKMKHLILILLILSSCSAQKRCEKHLNKAIKGGCLVNRVDTLFDTIKGFKTDTIFKGDTMHDVDTFLNEVNSYKVVTIVKWKDRIVNQEVSRNDTIIRTIHRTSIIKEPLKWYERIILKYWIYLFFISLILYIREAINKN